MKKAIRDSLTGKVDHYTNTKSVGLRNPFTGQIEKRISKEKAKGRGLATRTRTIWDK